MKNGIPEATHDLTRSEAIEHQWSNKFIAKFCVSGGTRWAKLGPTWPTCMSCEFCFSLELPWAILCQIYGDSICCGPDCSPSPCNRKVKLRKSELHTVLSKGQRLVHMVSASPYCESKYPHDRWLDWICQVLFLASQVLLLKLAANIFNIQ